ncbi:MAG: sigma-70 family RNA polymerase sigma factor [Gammaproteobacteria bacterium]|nr:sigma-70 family RNA polymerase sigma factor [Gammaproteobacteria bacterium]
MTMFDKKELDQLYRYALSLTVKEDVAYDLLQTALERYLRKSAKSVEKPLAYLKTVIRNLYFDLERHNKVVPMISFESDEITHVDQADDVSMDDVLINQQEVQQLIALLNSEENELLYLWAVEEHTVDEIARMYQKPRGTVLSKLHRLKKRIRQHTEMACMAEER